MKTLWWISISAASLGYGMSLGGLWKAYNFYEYIAYFILGLINIYTLSKAWKLKYNNQ